jgi:hypothetical protein
VFFDWAEILDMEVRVEDNLVLSDGEIVAVCIWETCDEVPELEGYADAFLDKLEEQVKTIEANKREKEE